MELIVSKRAFTLLVMAGLITAILIAPFFGFILKGAITRYHQLRINRPYLHSLCSNLLTMIILLLFLSISPHIGSGLIVGGAIFIIFYGINLSYYFCRIERSLALSERLFLANDLVILLIGIYMGIPITCGGLLFIYSFI